MRSHSLAVAVLAAMWFCGCEKAAADEPARVWKESQRWPAAEAHQAAAADARFLYAISSTEIVRYDRATGQRIAASRGAAMHLNSGFLDGGKLYCAHSNYPAQPARSEIKVLDLTTLELATYKDFGSFAGSLTWCVRHEGHWWCNFAHYRADNARTVLVRFDANWKELGRWTYPMKVVGQLGGNSISGGIWLGGEILATGHDDPVLFRLRLPPQGGELEYVGTDKIPFTGQGIAFDPVTGGLVGIHRSRKQVVVAQRADDRAP